MKRRSFFKSVARAVVIIALAPEICFRSKLDLPSAPRQKTATHLGLLEGWCQLVMKDNPLYLA